MPAAAARIKVTQANRRRDSPVSLRHLLVGVVEVQARLAAVEALRQVVGAAAHVRPLSGNGVLVG